MMISVTQTGRILADGQVRLVSYLARLVEAGCTAGQVETHLLGRGLISGGTLAARQAIASCLAAEVTAQGWTWERLQGETWGEVNVDAEEHVHVRIGGVA